MNECVLPVPGLQRQTAFHSSCGLHTCLLCFPSAPARYGQMNSDGDAHDVISSDPPPGAFFHFQLARAGMRA